VGFVFQSYALFPTKTVAENIGFGLAVRSRPKAEMAARVAELCELTRLQGLEDRYPHELSGGQQQRVALARALAPQPSMLLLDEPLSALDAKIRAHLRSEIRAVVDQLKVTTVYVTHDQEEALSIADRIAVMEAGKFLQVDTPLNIYLHPRQRFVADFVGTSNTLPGRPVGENWVEVDGVSLCAPVPVTLRGAPAVIVCIRPEHVVVRRADGDMAGGRGAVTAVTFAGPTVRARLSTAGGEALVADVPTHEWLMLGIRQGDAVTWSVRPEAPILLPATDG
jgi:ABC-type Fe3+/spermidine/putrescine transport system ATPase subunit